MFISEVDSYILMSHSTFPKIISRLFSQIETYHVKRNYPNYEK